jgi:hypothetical protein
MDERSAPATVKGKERKRRLESIRHRARERVRDDLMPALETAFQERLPAEMTWRLEPDPEASEEPTLLFILSRGISGHRVPALGGQDRAGRTLRYRAAGDT